MAGRQEAMADFFNMKKKQSVTLPDDHPSIRKTHKIKGNRHTYLVTAIDDDGTKMSRIYGREAWMAHPAPETADSAA